MLEQLCRNLRNRADFSFAVKYFRALGLKLNFAVIQPDLAASFFVTRIHDDEHDFAVEQVNPNIAPGDNLAHVPLARLLRIEQRRDAITRREARRSWFPNDTFLAWT